MEEILLCYNCWLMMITNNLQPNILELSRITQNSSLTIDKILINVANLKYDACFKYCFFFSNYKAQIVRLRNPCRIKQCPLGYKNQQCIIKRVCDDKILVF